MTIINSSKCPKKHLRNLNKIIRNSRYPNLFRQDNTKSKEWQALKLAALFCLILY